MTATIDFNSSYADAYLRKSASLIPAYEDLFRPACAFLHLRLGDCARLLLVGGGGGKELLAFGPMHHGWSFLVVDPSAKMADAARAKAHEHALAERTEILTATVDQVAAAPAFDAATCILVPHFLSEDGQRALLRDIASRLKPGAPLVLAQLYRPENDETFAMMLGVWRRFLLDCGESPEEVEEGFRAREHSVTFLTEPAILALLEKCGFRPLARYHTAMLFGGWLAERR